MVKNLITNDFYVGASTNMYRRWRNHVRELKDGCHGNSKMRNASLEHGAQSFTCQVLELCKVEELPSREQYFLDLLKPTYNKWLTCRIPHGYKHTPESIKKMTNNNKGIRDKEAFSKKLKRAWEVRRERSDGLATLKMLNRQDKPHSEEVRKKIAEHSKKMWACPEFREKMRLIRLAKKKEISDGI